MRLRIIGIRNSLIWRRKSYETKAGTEVVKELRVFIDNRLYLNFN